MPAGLTVTNQLALSSGLVRTAPTATLTLPDGATLGGEAPGRYVQGNLRVERGSGTGVLDFGHGLVLDRTGLGQVSATRTAGLQTDNLSRGVNLGNSSLRGIDRIWTVEAAVAPIAPTSVTLQWLQDDDNGLTFSVAQAWRAPLGSASWVASSGQQAATVAGGTRSFSFAAAALGRLTVSNSANPLPVELLSFTAQARGDGAWLHWTTASEINNDHFVVEASADGRTFRRIGQVAGAGNSTTPRSYELLDANVSRYAASIVYYRLRQVDTDGTETFSPVRAVRVAALLELAVEAFPNPLPPNQALSLGIRSATKGPALLSVSDALGRTRLRQPLALDPGYAVVELAAVAGWPEGVYLVRLEQDGGHQAVKVVHR